MGSDQKRIKTTREIRIICPQKNKSSSSPYACEPRLGGKLDKEGIKTINAKIDYLTGKKGYTKVLNKSTLQVAVNEILTFVFN